MMLNKKNSQPLYNLFFFFSGLHSMGTNCKFEICNVIGNCIVFLLNFKINKIMVPFMFLKHRP
jgi:hypothetical protein